MRSALEQRTPADGQCSRPAARIAVVLCAPDILPKDYDGTLHQVAALGYREVEAAGFFGHSPAEVKQAMDRAGLHCVSAHYPLNDLLPKVDETIQFGKDLGLSYIVCASSPAQGSFAREGSRISRRQRVDDTRRLATGMRISSITSARK